MAWFKTATTKHIFAPDGTLLATVEGASTTASTTYLHPDHLGGTDVTTDDDGEPAQPIRATILTRR